MSHGFGSVVPIVLANGIRLLASAAGALIAIHWFGLGAIGFFAAVANRILRVRGDGRQRHAG
jgi:hypothetical protein